MNQRLTGLNVTKAIIGFPQYKSAEGLSPVTVSGYEHDLKLWIEYQGDMDVAAVETTHIPAYLNYLRTDYVPRRITGNNDKKLSPKTVYNLYISVASFCTWASPEFNLNNPMKGIPRPRVAEAPRPIEPSKKEEIELLTKAWDFCEEAVTDHRRKFIIQRQVARCITQPRDLLHSERSLDLERKLEKGRQSPPLTQLIRISSPALPAWLLSTSRQLGLT